MVITVLVVSLVLVVPAAISANFITLNSDSTECARSVRETDKLEDNCISDFILLQQQALYCNKKNRFEILRVFRPINKDHPLAVFIVYKENFTSSSQKPSRLPSRQDDRCANMTAEEGVTVWVWMRTSIFLLIRPHILNWLSLRTLFHIQEWEWKQIKLEIPRVCEDVRDDYLAMLTKQIHFYAVGYHQLPLVDDEAYVMMGKSPDAFCGAIRPYERTESFVTFVDSVGALGNYLIVLAVLSFTTAWMSKKFPDLAKKSHEYTYQHYGMMWGVALASMVALPALMTYNIIATIYFYQLPSGAIFPSAPYHVTAMFVLYCVTEIPTALYYSVKYRMALPVTIQRVTSRLCGAKVANCVHVMVQMYAMFNVLFVLQGISAHLLWILVAFAANPYTVLVSTAGLVVVAFSGVHLFAVLVTLPHIHTGGRGLTRKVRITLLQVASTIFFIIVAGCIIIIIAATNKVMTTESNIFSIFRILITPGMVAITFIIHKLVKSYFTLQGVACDEERRSPLYFWRKRKTLEMSPPAVISNGDGELTQSLLQREERDSEWEPHGEREQKYQQEIQIEESSLLK
jgi:hypothetical protein